MILASSDICQIMFITFCRILHAACILQEHPSVMSMSCGSICLQQRKEKWSLGNLQCNDCLHMHALRANYQAAIWQRCLERNPEIPPPQSGHGWELDETGHLCFKWMEGAPTPEVFLEFLSCKCRRVCKVPDCPCLSNGLKCTDACYLKDCSNMRSEDDEQNEQDISDEEI